MILEPCKVAKKAQIKGPNITRGRSWSLTFFGKRDNNTTIAENIPIEKMTNITYTGDELLLAPTCDYTTPERVELVADLCPECIHTFELCKIDHAHAQQYVRDWRNQNGFGLEYGPLTFVEANGGLTVKKTPVDNYDRGSTEKFYTHRATKPTKQDIQDHERVSEETVARRTRRHDQEDEEEAEKHARRVARYEKKLIFKMHDQETRENTIANAGIRYVLSPRRNSEVFRANPESDAADRQAYTRMPRGDCCPETFVNLELEHEPEDPIQQERYMQDEAARQIKKMAIQGDYNSAATDAEAHKKAQVAALEAKLKEKVKVKNIKEEALHKQKERAVQQEASIFANVDPRGRSGTNFNVSNSTFGLNVIGRRPSVPPPQQSQSQWPQQRQSPPRNVTFKNENRRPSDARRPCENRGPSRPTPPQAQSEWPQQCRPPPNGTEIFEVQRRERPPTDHSVQRPGLQPQRANSASQRSVRPLPTPMRNNTVFPGAADFSYPKNSAKSARKSKHAAIDAYGDAYGPRSHDRTSSGEWAENDPEGIQLQELAVKSSRRQRSQSRAQNYKLPTERTGGNRNFSFSGDDAEVLRPPPPAARLPWVPASTKAQRTGIHGLHTDSHVIARSRSIFERARQASFSRVRRPAWMVDEAAANYNVEAQNTSFGSFGSQRPIMGSPEQMAVQDDIQVFVVGNEEENEASRTPVPATFQDWAALPRSPIQNARSSIHISRSPIQISRSLNQPLQTPARPRGSFSHPKYSPSLDVYGARVTDDSSAADGITNDSFGLSHPTCPEGSLIRPQYTPGLDVYGVSDDSSSAICRSPIQLLQTPARPEGRFSCQPEYADLDVYGAAATDDDYGSSRPTPAGASSSRPQYSPSLDVYGAGISHDSSGGYGVSDNCDSGRPTWGRRLPPPPKDGEFIMSPEGENSGRGKMPFTVV